MDEMKYSKGDWTKSYIENCEILCDDEYYCTVQTDEVDMIIDVLNENEQLKQTIDRLTLDNTKQKKMLNITKKENKQLKQSNERIVKDIDLALGFIRHKGYSLQDIKDYEDAKKEYEEDLAYYRKGDVE